MKGTLLDLAALLCAGFLMVAAFDRGTVWAVLTACGLSVYALSLRLGAHDQTTNRPS